MLRYAMTRNILTNLVAGMSGRGLNHAGLVPTPAPASRLASPIRLLFSGSQRKVRHLCCGRFCRNVGSPWSERAFGVQALPNAHVDINELRSA